MICFPFNFCKSRPICKGFGRARKMLTMDSTKLSIHTLVTPRLDYCNSLFAGINTTLLNRFQKIQRTAARLITGKRKYDPISDNLELHWLPVKQHINSKSWLSHSNVFINKLRTIFLTSFTYKLIAGLFALAQPLFYSNQRLNTKLLPIVLFHATHLASGIRFQIISESQIQLLCSRNS